MAGVTTSAVCAYFAGKALPQKAIERLMPRRLRDVRAVLRARGFAASLALSIIPVAPFAVVGIAVGAMRVKLREYVPGVLVGHLPGTITTSILGHQLKYALEDRARLSPMVVAGAVLFLVVSSLVVRRWFRGELRAVSERTT
jgi:phospholipase D1/2